MHAQGQQQNEGMSVFVGTQRQSTERIASHHGTECEDMEWTLAEWNEPQLGPTKSTFPRQL